MWSKAQMGAVENELKKKKKPVVCHVRRCDVSMYPSGKGSLHFTVFQFPKIWSKHQQIYDLSVGDSCMNGVTSDQHTLL